MALKYLGNVGGKYKAPLRNDGGKTIAYLIWGDPVRTSTVKSGMVKVRARGQDGWVPSSALVDRGLLEFYVIDVGQGDGVLVRTPDDRWHVIDAGVTNAAQMTKKGAANFIRWKFLEDLGREGVTLANVVLTHPDSDHYGGMMDLFGGQLAGHPPFSVSVENLYHPGMGRFATAPKLGKDTPGTVPALPNPALRVDRTGRFITELLDGKPSFAEPPRPFDEDFGRFAAAVARVPTTVRRLSHRDQFLPGYGPNEGPVTVRVLGPILERPDGQRDGLRVLPSESETRNGHSIVLRFDYGLTRFLLTGDLNSASQRLLLGYQPEGEFAADVAKACHHGSDDVDLRFVKAMKARTTVISSGDNEDYAHPRPRVLGASARYGRESEAASGQVLPPLVYSTELARSVKLAYAASVRPCDAETPVLKARDAEVMPAVAGAKYRPFERTPISTDLVYGLINVRTDGQAVLCAYMKEKGGDFDVQVFRAGVDV